MCVFIHITDGFVKCIMVIFEEIEKEDWTEKVYKPDILNRKDSLYREPGYNPFE